MRLEAIEKEADLFAGEEECYVHMEKTKGSDMKVVTNGGRAGLSLACYVLLLNVAENIGTSPKNLLKFYRRILRKHGEIGYEKY